MEKGERRREKGGAEGEKRTGIPPLRFTERGSGGEVDVTRGTGSEAPYRNLSDLRQRARLSADDLRTLVKAGACDSIACGMTRPMMLWAVDTQAVPPRLPEYDADRRRREAYAALGFLTAEHPMDLHAERLRRFRVVRSPDLPRHVGQSVLLAGMLTTAKPVHTAADEPMQFATFDDGHGLVEAVLFPDVYRARGHVLFNQGPFLLKGRVEEEFGAITVTVTHLERLERIPARQGA